MTSTVTEKHVHFPPDLASGSHRETGEFRSPKENQEQRIFSIRNNVPFDLWYSYNRSGNGSFWSERGGAVVAFFKGLAFTFVEAIKYLYHSIFGTNSQKSMAGDYLGEQWDGLKLSGIAIISPISAREKFQAYWATFPNRQETLYHELD